LLTQPGDLEIHAHIGLAEIIAPRLVTTKRPRRKLKKRKIKKTPHLRRRRERVPRRVAVRSRNEEEELGFRLDARGTSW